MIDLMMCLIIFFILAAKLSTDDVSAEVILPTVRSPTKIDPGKLGDRLVVNIVPPDEKMAAKGKKEYEKVRYISRAKEYTLDELEKMMEANAKTNENFKLVIRPHENATYDMMQGLMYRAGKVNVKHMIFAAGDAGLDERRRKR
jgi:biopolymer transport protein ExbD